jgi:hypothetical protein
MITKTILLIMLIPLFSACSSSEAPEPPPKTLNDVLKKQSVPDMQIVPTVDGGAYIITDYGAWHLKDNKATKVIEGESENGKQSKLGNPEIDEDPFAATRKEIELQKKIPFLAWNYGATWRRAERRRQEKANTESE